MEFLKGARGMSRLMLTRVVPVLILALCLVLGAALAEARMMPKTSPKQKISGRYIVVLHDSIPDPDAVANQSARAQRICGPDSQIHPACTEAKFEYRFY